MDKTEYHLKLEEINRLVDAQDYEGALTVADSIDWRRVKSVRTLCMVADIYEVNGELEKSMQMLQLARKRSSIGKMILYRQVELALKMGLYDDAVKYYNEYLETASNDTSKYILKYKIYKAQKAPLENRIAILEEYKEREYTERWVYELAKLYKKAGQEKKCVETCDDLVLWFGEGKYVTKAMELKMTYTPLSPSQKEKYEKAKAAGKVAKPTAGPKLTEEVKNTILPGVSAAAMAGLQKVEEEKEQAQEEVAATAEIPQESAGTTVEETPATEEEPVKPETEIPHIDTEKLQERLSRSFQEILSGFNRTKAVDAFEALGRAAGAEVPQEPEAQEENMEEYHVQDLEPEAVNEGIISADSGVAGVSRTEMDELEMMEKPKVEKPEDKEIISVQEVDLDALFAETSSSLAKEAGEDAAEKAEEEPAVEKVTAEEIIGEPEEVVAEETVDAAGDVLEERVEGAVETVTEEEPAETLTDAADEAMAAFEASLSGLSLDFAEETSSDAPETETSAESTEEPDYIYTISTQGHGAYPEEQLIDDPEISIEGLMEHINAPDFPTGGEIYGMQGVKDAFETGRGRIILRDKAEIENDGNHDMIVISEIPYGVLKGELVKSIHTLAEETKIDGIADVTDTSARGISAGSYKDLTRVAYLNEEMWTELFLDNRDNLLFELDTIIASLQQYADAMRANDPAALKELLREGREAKERIDL